MVLGVADGASMPDSWAHQHIPAPSSTTTRVLAGAVIPCLRVCSGHHARMPAAETAYSQAVLGVRGE